MSNWKFPGAPKYYRKFNYYGEVGDPILHRDGGHIVVSRWEGKVPHSGHWGAGVLVEEPATTVRLRREDCVACLAKPGQPHSVGCPEKPLAVAGTPERGAGLKFDSGKPRWSLLMQGCCRALLGVVNVLTFGAKKYSADSWRQVENGEERYRDALYRHLNAIESGEVIDPESGESHWAHVATNALFLEELRLAAKPARA